MWRGIADGAQIGMTGIGFAFGLAIVAAAHGLGPISGAHLNPAVSLGALLAGRMTGTALATYVAAQVLGAVIGAAVLYLIASGQAGYELGVNGLGQNGYGAGYLREYSLTSALLFETVMTFVFVTVILGATRDGAPAAMARLATGDGEIPGDGGCGLPASPFVFGGPRGQPISGPDLP